MDDGKVLAAHCDCMAGLGDSCSHVASLLWVVAVGVQRWESLAETQKSAYWVIASLNRINVSISCLNGVSGMRPTSPVKKHVLSDCSL